MTIKLPTMKVKCSNKECRKTFERFTYNGENVQKYWCPECTKQAITMYNIAGVAPKR